MMHHDMPVTHRYFPRPTDSVVPTVSARIPPVRCGARRTKNHSLAALGIWLLVIASRSATLGLAQESTVAAPTSAEQLAWTSLFDGKTLEGWEVVHGYDDGDRGKVAVQDGHIVIGAGSPVTGVRWTREFPRARYEVEFEAQRVSGDDFFCGFSFPVGDGSLTLILGGWGGWVVGLSCVDGQRAVDNETGTARDFQNDRWYRMRIRVTREKVSTYLDDKFLCGLETRQHKLNVTPEMEPCLPLGFATWKTTGAIRGVRYRELPPDAADGKPSP